MRLFAIAAAGFLIALAAPSAKAATFDRCGVGLIAGLSICIDWHMTVSEHRDLAKKARAGDGDAAMTLANFETLREDVKVRSREWDVLAAEHGKCDAIRHVLREAKERRQRNAVAKWQTRMRWNRCSDLP